MPASVRLWLPAVVSMVVLVPFAVVQAARADGPFAYLAVIIAVGASAALLLRRRFPGPVVVATAALTLIGLLVATSTGGPPFGPPPLALAFAVVSAIAHGARTWALASVAAAWLIALGAGLVSGELWSPVRIIWTSIFVLGAVGVGEFRRTRRERYVAFRRAAQQRRDDAEQTERLRIARELHDVLSHSLSSIAVQAGVGLHLLDSQPERAGEALAAIRLASTSALDEVRSVLGVLRADEAAPLRPAPDLSQLDELARGAEASGMTVTVQNRVVCDPSAAVQLAIYRIVQESLTNAVRHAAATSVTVTLDETNGSVEVTIDDDGRGPASELGDGGGRGLLGMRERAELQGGSFSAGPRPGGGFRVQAVLPIAEPVSP